MWNRKSKNYDAAGFVEALIAIMITGVSSVVLMQLAVNTVQNMIQNEVIDTMTQYAVEGSTMVQSIALQQKLTGESLFPNVGGQCYLVNQDDTGKYYFVKENEGGEIFKSYTLAQRDVYKEDAVISTDDKYFRIFCISSNYQTADSYAVVQIVVGQTNSDGKITKGNNVADYTYYTVADL